MKTKHLFTAMCLPALFAACTADDLTDSMSQNLNREAIDFKLTPQSMQWGGPSTRMEGNLVGTEIQYSWTSTDVIGAAMVDGTKMGNVNADNVVWSNIPFTTKGTAEDSEFTTQSQVMKGMYFFYYPFNESTSREELTLKTEADQKFVKGDGKVSPYSQMAQYIVNVSPLFDLQENGMKYNASLNLPVKFAKLSSPLIVRIKSDNAKPGTKIEKVVLKKADASKIVNGGVINFSEVEKAKVEGTKLLDAEAVTTAQKTLIENVNKTGGNALFVSDGSIIKVDAITLTTDDSETDKGLTITNGEEIVVCLAVPCLGDKTDYIITVETSEGYCDVSKSFAVISGSANNMKDPIELNFAENGNVQQRSTFPISSSDDWANAIDYVNAHSSAYIGSTVQFELQQKGNLTISSLPSFPVTVTKKADVSEDAVLLVDTDFAISKINEAKTQLTLTDVKLGVGAGKTLTVDAVPTAEVMNYGTMEVGAITFTAKVTNFGTMKVNEDATFAAITNGQVASGEQGTPEYVPAYNANIAVNGKATMTLNAAITNVVGSTITINKGTTLAATSNVITNGGTIVNNGTLSSTQAIANTGDIQSNGVHTAAVTNNGTMEIGAGSTSNATSAITNNATITVVNLDDFVTLQADISKKYVINNAGTGRTTVVVTDKAGYEDANVAGQGINHITLKGGSWKMAKTETEGVIAEPVTAIAGITLDGATLDVTEAPNNAIAAVTTIGTSKLMTTSASAVTVKIGNLVVENGTLTVADNIQVNENKSSNDATATISGALVLTAANSGTPTAATKVYFGGNVKINEGGVLTGVTGAEFGVQNTATFANDGTINVNGGTISWPSAGAGTIMGAGDANIGNGWGA